MHIAFSSLARARTFMCIASHGMAIWSALLLANMAWVMGAESQTEIRVSSLSGDIHVSTAWGQGRQGADSFDFNYAVI